MSRSKKTMTRRILNRQKPTKTLNQTASKPKQTVIFDPPFIIINLSQSTLCNIIQSKANNSLIVSLQSLHHFSLLHVPQFDSLVSAAGN